MITQRLCVSILFVMSLSLVLFLGACTNYTRQRGVENVWRTVDQKEIVSGKTTQMEIAKRLGPPSQVINLKSGPVFYYLTEQTKGGGAILILFNSLDEKITYDRAVFFFDEKGILIDYAFSNETIEYDKP